MLEGGPFRGLFLRGLNLDHECGIPSRAPPNVPYLAPDMRNGLVLVHCTLYKRVTIREWERVMLADECHFHTKMSTRGRRIRISRSAST